MCAEMCKAEESIPYSLTGRENAFVSKTKLQKEYEKLSLKLCWQYCALG